MTKNIPFFPILHVFASLNDVCTYIACSWKATLITWIFLRGWYPTWNISFPPPPRQQLLGDNLSLGWGGWEQAQPTINKMHGYMFGLRFHSWPHKGICWGQGVSKWEIDFTHRNHMFVAKNQRVCFHLVLALWSLGEKTWCGVFGWQLKDFKQSNCIQGRQVLFGTNKYLL